MQQGVDAARKKLKDGDSAKFQGVYFHQGADNFPITCGEVNAKNSFGAYSGYQKFISGGKPELTWIEDQVSDFEKTWDRFCR